MGALDSVIQAAANLFQRRPPTVVGSDGSTTYGPAVTRLTRTPVQYVAGDIPGHPGAVGAYGSSGITIAPNAASNLNEVTNHESIHALLNDPALLAAANSGPQAQAMRSVMPNFVGDAQQEMPAYLATGEINRLPRGNTVTDAGRSGALNEVMANVARQNPAAGALFKRLSRMHADGPTQ